MLLCSNSYNLGAIEQTYMFTQKLTLKQAIQYRDLCMLLQHIGFNDILAYISETYLIDVSRILREPTRLSNNTQYIP